MNFAHALHLWVSFVYQNERLLFHEASLTNSSFGIMMFSVCFLDSGNKGFRLYFNELQPLIILSVTEELISK
jgi:hypothetical protein